MSSLPADTAELDEIVRAVAEHPGLAAKSAIGLVSEVLGGGDWLGGPGDDGAVVALSAAPGGVTGQAVTGQAVVGQVVVGGEAMWPPFVAADPRGAGFAAVLTNVNDLAAMGAEPLGIVDTVVAGEDVARAALEGMRAACELYDVRVLGGHLTLHAGEPAISAFGVGEAPAPLSVTRAAPGQSLVVAAATDGAMRSDFAFFPAFDARGTRCAGDVRLLGALARSGAVVAAKDISMAGLVGSLGMMLEYARLGVEIDLDAVPRPPGVTTAAWLTCFPSFGFLLAVPSGREDETVDAFRARGLEAGTVGALDASGTIRLRRGTAVATALDLATHPVTRLARAER